MQHRRSVHELFYLRRREGNEVKYLFKEFAPFTLRGYSNKTIVKFDLEPLSLKRRTIDNEEDATKYVFTWPILSSRGGRYHQYPKDSRRPAVPPLSSTGLFYFAIPRAFIKRLTDD